MTNYQQQAKDFLVSCNATMEITKIGVEKNKLWNDQQFRNTYRATITTPLGTMWVKFWDSYDNRAKGITPTEYDILACLQKYDVGDFDDFVSEFGYDIEEPADRRRVLQIYKAVVNEYKSVCRCFTEEQIDAMCEIQ